MIPALVVFLYLGVVLAIGLFAGRASARRPRRRGLLPGRAVARPGGVPAVALRREHDGVLDPRRLGPRLRQRHRHLRADGVLVGADHPAQPLRGRHAAVGARQAARLHHAGADVPRPLGVRAHRHRDLRGAGRPAGALHRHRGDRRRHDAARRQRRAGPVLAGRRHRLAGGDGRTSSSAGCAARRGSTRFRRCSSSSFGDDRGARSSRAGMGGFRQAVEALLAAPATAPLLTRERVSPLYFFSYTFIPLSSIAFPHIGIFCLTARRLAHFRRTVVLYPICMLAIWLPSVFLGVIANRAVDVPAIAAKLDARATLAAAGPALPPAQRDDLRARAARRRCHPRPGRGICSAVADGAARGVGDGRGHGERLADSGAVDDVHRGRGRVLPGREARA